MEMGGVLLELAKVLRSKNLTSQEANELMSCKAQAVRGFTVAAGASGGVVWLATLRLGIILRVNLVGGISYCYGLYRCGQALDSCVEHILNQKGSRMQQELANILVRRYWDDQSMMQRISKHFYPENVFDDSSVDKPYLRLRSRNFFGEIATGSQNTWDDSYNEKNDVKPKPTNVNSEVKATSDPTSDPFDHVFGTPSTDDEVNHPASPTMVPKRQTRSQKRSKRRQRIIKRGASQNLQHALVDEDV